MRTRESAESRVGREKRAFIGQVQGEEKCLLLGDTERKGSLGPNKCGSDESMVEESRKEDPAYSLEKVQLRREGADSSKSKREGG